MKNNLMKDILHVYTMSVYEKFRSSKEFTIAFKKYKRALKSLKSLEYIDDKIQAAKACLKALKACKRTDNSLIHTNKHAKKKRIGKTMFRKKHNKPRIRKKTVLDLLKIGDKLHLTTNKDVTATVQSDGTILYNGTSGSLSTTALMAINDHKNIDEERQTTANGWYYWSHNGTSLAKLDPNFGDVNDE
tara:strand:- start:1492 stop:2055 length:564 start_codon:yes stop_codon:yes gene_type:complete